jgi:tetratricopeptide (TPR) repeat protein
VSAFLASAIPLTAGTARAQETADKGAAKEHYDKGKALFDIGRYDEAIKEFEASYQLKQDAAILFNLAQAHRLAGNNDRALTLYRTYVRNWPKGANRAEAEKHIGTLEQKLATPGGGGTTPPPANTTTPPPANTTTTPPANTTTTPPGNEPNVTVPPGSTPPPPDYTPPPGYTPPPPGYTQPPPVAATSDPGRPFRIAGMASAGVGAVMLVLGIVEWRRAVTASHDVETAAASGDQFDPDVQKRGQSAETMQWVFYSIGLVAAGAGVGLWMYGQRLTAASETTTWRVSLAPTVAPNQGGALLRIAF